MRLPACVEDTPDRSSKPGRGRVVKLLRQHGRLDSANRDRNKTHQQRQTGAERREEGDDTGGGGQFPDEIQPHTRQQHADRGTAPPGGSRSAADGQDPSLQRLKRLLESRRRHANCSLSGNHE